MQDGDIKVSHEALETRRMIEPPIQPTVKGGSIVLEMSMWHAGMPNHTVNPRPMIAMIHYVSCWQTEPLRFAAGSGAFEHPDLKTDAMFVKGSIDYISTPGAFEFTK